MTEPKCPACEAESEDHAATVTGDREKLTARLRHGAEVVDWYSHECADTMREAADALAAPVEVDEAKLAELADMIDSREWTWSTFGNTLGRQIAELVAEWLRGEGR
ncbi:hypothetical protein SAMN04488565_2626 [Leucobacter chromiiresistens]|uniref:Uncharacterized protein n=1 Tax=Leucobacter chromiiresistens TaxID=1079994 RepID=A0A1H1B763_9MICO|nr:hypothetical protein SAMN04488565_2626 [Leucobacter chromiiresistens]